MESRQTPQYRYKLTSAANAQHATYVYGDDCDVRNGNIHIFHRLVWEEDEEPKLYTVWVRPWDEFAAVEALDTKTGLPVAT